MQDVEIFNEFVEEARDHLADVESQLLQIEAFGANINDDLVNTVFRAIHSVKGAAGFLGLTQINNVAHGLENILGKVRDHQLVPDPFNVDVMLKAADRLRNLIEDIENSNATDNSELCKKLDEVLEGKIGASKVAATALPSDSPVQEGSEPAEDDDAAPKPPRKTASTRKKPAAKRRSPSKKVRKEGPAKNDSTADPANVADAVATNLDEIETQVSEASAPQSPEVPKSPSSPKPAGSPGKSSNSPAPNAQNAAGKPATSSAPEATIRVGVRVLDRLMNLAGELVLSRNQLIRVLNESNRSGNNLDAIVSGLDQVTTELQEAIMQTRMQPIGNVFNKFPRLIRDLSATLGKNINLTLEGTEVETDKTIVEAIADPLTHLVRNSCDHGIENPAKRASAGKRAEGTVVLRAFHKAGKVMIEIVDDGAGMNPETLRRKAVEKGVITQEVAESMSDREAVNLIFAPGFSTAAEITSVSGRGVGMDVVRTNIEKIGGNVEVESRLGYGSTIRITLPLTLAIVPSMILSIGGRPFALPQANIVELVQTGGEDKRVEHVNNAEVLRLRGNLLPLVRLASLLGVTPNSECHETQPQVVVVEAGRSRFALAVDRVLDSEEIVVKPLGRHLSGLQLFAGATILGDGKVALILDAAGVSTRAQIGSDQEGCSSIDQSLDSDSNSTNETQRFVLLSTSRSDHFAISMDLVSRIERVQASRIDSIGDRKVIQYRGGTLPLLAIEDAIQVNAVDAEEYVHIVVFKVYGREVGLVAPHLNDIRDFDASLSDNSATQSGVAGIVVVDERTTRILDVYGLTKQVRPEWFDRPQNAAEAEEKRSLHILVCEDSPFFRNFLTRALVEEGHKVSAYEHGEEGWSILTEYPDRFDLLLTDVEMPELDGISLTKRVRADGRFDELPIIALTSLSDEESVARGRAAGVNDYQVKMNKPELLASITKLTNKGAKV